MWRSEKKKLSGKKWKVYWACLVEGGIYVYSSSSNSEPKLSINLEHATIVMQKYDKKKRKECAEKKKFHFLVNVEKQSFYISSQDFMEFASWLERFGKSIGKEMRSVPKKEVRDTRTDDTVMFRAKKNISSKVSNLSVVKAKVLNQYTKALVDALFKIVKTEADADKAAEVERYLLKMVVKGYFQVEKGNISEERVRALDKMLRESFLCFDRYVSIPKLSILLDLSYVEYLGIMS